MQSTEMAGVDEEDPYALSSDTDTESLKGPPPKINIEGRSIADLSSLKAALTETREAAKDEERLEELNKLKEKAEIIAKIKREFIEGKVKGDSDIETRAVDEERKQIVAVTKEKYAKFKDKFEKMPELMEQGLEERLKLIEKELAGVGKENLENIKETFENPRQENDVEREQIVIERSAADMKRIKNTFIEPEMTADDAPKECAVCTKIVYPVERIFANKRNYHVQCFKCSKCGKKLTGTNYNMHEGELLCKVHYLEIFHPEIAKTMDPNTTEEDERFETDEEEEYAISSKPKVLGDDVIKSGAKVEDFSTFIGSLKARKGDWESSAKEASSGTVEKKSVVEEIASGKVKENLEKFVSGTAKEENTEGEDEEDRDPNIIRENRRRRKEELNFEQVENIKNKWKSGNVEGAEVREMSKEELEELKKGPAIRDRFKERNQDDERIVKQWDRSEIDTSGAADARRQFQEGAAFQSGPVEKTAAELAEIEFKKLQAFKERFEKGEEEVPLERAEIDVHANLGDLKSNFENADVSQMTAEERAELKKKEIEEEFQRYKLARKAAALKAAAEKAESGGTDGAGGKQLDVEIKVAGKAREKFRQIDAEGMQAMASEPYSKEKHVSKWDKTEGAVPEPINRRVIESDEEPMEDDFDVKNLMNKFQNIEKEDTSKVKYERPSDLEEIKVAARNLKEQFERVATEGDNESAEEKRKRLEEEFERLRREREEAAAAHEETPEAEALPQKEEIQVAADHATKMAAKWEKIQKKEAKRAEKSRMPQRSATHTDK